MSKQETKKGIETVKGTKLLLSFEVSGVETFIRFGTKSEITFFSNTWANRFCDWYNYKIGVLEQDVLDCFRNFVELFLLKVRENKTTEYQVMLFNMDDINLVAEVNGNDFIFQMWNA